MFSANKIVIQTQRFFVCKKIVCFARGVKFSKSSCEFDLRVFTFAKKFLNQFIGNKI